MPWTYEQASGRFLFPDGDFAATAYSGNGAGLNNPDEQDRIGVGPVPCGQYTIGPPHKPVDHLGPWALPLWPDKGNEMHGRSGFFVHGDNQRMNHTASNGCIIAGPAFRRVLAGSGDKVLLVVARAPPG